MKVWVDAQLPPSLAATLRREFAVDALHVVDLGLESATDLQIFERARSSGEVVVTKDADFVRLVETHGPPPKILWLTIGNARNAELQRLVVEHRPRVVEHFARGEALVEIQRRD